MYIYIKQKYMYLAKYEDRFIRRKEGKKEKILS